MVIVHSSKPEERTALASVAIVDRDGKIEYEKFVRPPSDRRINERSRKFCPVTDQQFDIARYTAEAKFDDVHRQVLDILQR